MWRVVRQRRELGRWRKEWGKKRVYRLQSAGPSVQTRPAGSPAWPVAAAYRQIARHVYIFRASLRRLPISSAVSPFSPLPLPPWSSAEKLRATLSSTRRFPVRTRLGRRRNDGRFSDQRLVRRVRLNFFYGLGIASVCVFTSVTSFNNGENIGKIR